MARFVGSIGMAKMACAAVFMTLFKVIQALTFKLQIGLFCHPQAVSKCDVAILFMVFKPLSVR